MILRRLFTTGIDTAAFAFFPVAFFYFMTPFLTPQPQDKLLTGWIDSENVDIIIRYMCIIVIPFIIAIIANFALSAWWSIFSEKTVFRLYRALIVFPSISLVVAFLVIHKLVEPYHVEKEMAVHYLAAGSIACIALYLRDDIAIMFRRMVQREIHIKLPMLVASSPILIGYDRYIWQKRNMCPTFDWTYAGVTALQSLMREDGSSGDRICAAVVSDFSLCLEFGKGTNGEKLTDYFILPFTVVTNSLAVISKSPANVSGGDLNSIDYYSESIQEEFLLRFGKQAGIQPGEAQKNMLEAIVRNSSGNSKGFMLWEPYYAIFERDDRDDTSPLNDFSVVYKPMASEARDREDSVNFRWVLCFVCKKRNIDEQCANDILQTMREACAESNDKSLLNTVIRRFLPEEISGLKTEDITKITREKTHQFDVASAVKCMFDDHAGTLSARIGDNYEGTLRTCSEGAKAIRQRYKSDVLWPGLNAIMGR